jgi:uncharacterized protein
MIAAAKSYPAPSISRLMVAIGSFGDYPTAARLFLPLAEGGNVRAQVVLGVLYEKQRTYSEAVKWLRLAADQHDADAENALGRIYENGEGVAQDYSKALSFYRLSAEQGNAYGRLSLGRTYSAGTGVRKDFAEAEKWIRLAANQGVPAAQLALGLMYINQEGVPQDDVNAHMWLNLAAARGIRDAIELRDKIAELVTPEQIAHAQQLARDWKPKR